MKYPRTIKKYKINSCVEPKSYKSNENLEGGSEQKDVEMQQKIQRDQGSSQISEDNSGLTAISPKKLSRLKPILLGLSCFTALLIFTLIILVIKYETTKSTEEICETPECLRSAATLRMNLDLTADPCEDFYQYTCGNWANNHPSYESYNSWTSNMQKRVSQKVRMFLERDNSEDEPLPVKQIRSLYSACMNTDAINEAGYHTLEMFMEKIGFPAIPKYLMGYSSGELNDTRTEVLLARIQRYYGIQVILTSGINSDLRNRSISRIAIYAHDTDEEDSGIPQFIYYGILKTMNRFRPLYESDTDEEEQLRYINTDYGLYLSRVINEYLEKTTRLTPSEEELDSVVESITSIGLKLQEIYQLVKKMNESDNLLDDIMEISVSSLQNLTDEWVNKATDGNVTSFPFWKTYLEEVLLDSPEFLVDLDNREVQIMKKDLYYLEQIFGYVLAKESSEKVDLFIWWTLLNDMVIHTTDEMRKFHQDYRDDKSQPSRSAHCIRIVEMMEMALTYAIADQGFLEEIKPKLEIMLDSIKEAFYQIVDELDWMDEVSKRETREKARQIVGLIGFPLWILNGTALEEYYDYININQSDYLGALLTLLEWNVQRVPKDQWQTNPTEVNAYFDRELNSIVLHLAYLQFPIYHLGLESLNYGAAGSTIGHELTHGFDSVGRYFDKNGNMIQWWTNQTINAFVNRTKCFVEQYSSYEVPKIGTKVDGKLTLDENIADNGGLRQAYTAYQKYQKRHGLENRLPGFRNYTAEQLFFLSYANSFCDAENVASLRSLVEDTHSPDRIRVIGSLSNFPEFAAAFKCGDSDKMVAKKMCRIW